jgi:hypothetical protein
MPYDMTGPGTTVPGITALAQGLVNDLLNQAHAQHLFVQEGGERFILLHYVSVGSNGGNLVEYAMLEDSELFFHFERMPFGTPNMELDFHFVTPAAMAEHMLTPQQQSTIFTSGNGIGHLIQAMAGRARTSEMIINNE